MQDAAQLSKWILGDAQDEEGTRKPRREADGRMEFVAGSIRQFNRQGTKKLDPQRAILENRRLDTDFDELIIQDSFRGSAMGGARSSHNPIGGSIASAKIRDT